MLERLRESWHQFKDLEPGSRFVEYARQRRRSGEHGARRVLTFAGGMALIIIGAVALVAPGPGMLMVALGAGLIARESITVARALDWLELRLRALKDRGVGIWKRAPVAARVFFVLIAAAAAAGAAWVAWTIMFG